MKNETEKRYINVHMKRKVFEDLYLDDQPTLQIKNWVAVGRERSQTKKDLDQVKIELAEARRESGELQRKMDRMIKMLAIFAHHNYVKEPTEQRKIEISYKIRDTFFPEFRIPTFLKDLDEWLEKQDPYGVEE